MLAKQQEAQAKAKYAEEREKVHLQFVNNCYFTWERLTTTVSRDCTCSRTVAFGKWTRRFLVHALRALGVG